VSATAENIKLGDSTGGMLWIGSPDVSMSKTNGWIVFDLTSVGGTNESKTFYCVWHGMRINAEGVNGIDLLKFRGQYYNIQGNQAMPAHTVSVNIIWEKVAF
jgi:hypothetical protein